MRRIALAPLLLLLAVSAPTVAAAEPVPRTFALEMQGKVIGLYTVTEEPLPEGLVRRVQRTEARLSLVGQPFDLTVVETTVSEAATGRLVRTTRVRRTGESEATQSAKVEGGRVVFGDGTEVPAKKPVDPLDGRALLAATAEGPAVIEVVSVQLSRVIEMEVRREGESDGVATFVMEGRDLPVRTTLLFEKETGRFAGLRDLRQGVSIRPAPPSVLQAAERADVAEALSLRVDLPVDFRDLTFLSLRAVIEAPGEPVTPESLNVPGQTFEGTVEKGVIRGVFTIRKRVHEGRGKLAIEREYPPEIAKYLEATPEIDAKHEEVVAQMRRVLGPDNSATEWSYATGLAGWVKENVAYGLPGKKASEVLASRSGDCGGQSRLLAAMCRATGIPARIVAGGMYSSFLGGAFTQHAWVEVYLAEDGGWFPLDPTAGEDEGIDAGHIRIGEKVAFHPKEIEILDYAPKALPGKPQPLPFAPGRVYRYDYLQGGKPIGANTFTYSLEGGRTRTEISTRMGAIATSSVLVTDAKGYPLSYRLEMTTPKGKGRVEETFSGGTVKVHAEPIGQPPRDLSQEVGTAFYLFDNNSLPHWALFLPRLGLAPGKTVATRVFHPQLVRVFVLTFEAGGWEEIEVGGEKVKAMPVRTKLSGKTLTFWLDESHRLVAEEEGPLRVELAR